LQIFLYLLDMDIGEYRAVLIIVNYENPKPHQVGLLKQPGFNPQKNNPN